MEDTTSSYVIQALYHVATKN